jgi:hypothetical protein
LDFSVILPVHNEGRLLPYTLPSIRALDPGEVVVVFDRCTDNSERVVDKLLDGLNVKKVYNNIRSDWNSHLSYLYHSAVEASSEGKLLFTQADVVLDKKIAKHVRFFRKGMISFRVLPYPNNPRSIVNTAVSLLQTRLLGGFSGVFVLDRGTYEDCRLTASDQFEFDSQLLRNIQAKKYPYRLVLTKCWNLRPYHGKHRRFELGKAKAKSGKKPYEVLAFSILRLMPEVYIGYQHERGMGK